MKWSSCTRAALVLLRMGVFYPIFIAVLVLLVAS